ncbi:hypothetical protein [Ectothiorhodospira lacustris]|uniref:hypothetical protein n=1 Tax=Ectothiorhodospira lacustris TaxID=2899127 RepID=UPI001EE85231|nr:hypothetical protein [Ectothiorhodospira lacustris]MCG5509636.1 hypothetical protein [Ectothiorhodospira lacustris]MCG5521569.1 hypothetical protein [Ectothiorhodospira lacustris]
MPFSVITKTGRGWELASEPHPSALVAVSDMASLDQRGFSPRCVVDGVNRDAAINGEAFTPVCDNEPGSVRRFLATSARPSYEPPKTEAPKASSPAALTGMPVYAALPFVVSNGNRRIHQSEWEAACKAGRLPEGFTARQTMPGGESRIVPDAEVKAVMQSTG